MLPFYASLSLGRSFDLNDDSSGILPAYRWRHPNAGSLGLVSPFPRGPIRFSLPLTKGIFPPRTCEAAVQQFHAEG